MIGRSVAAVSYPYKCTGKDRMRIAGGTAGFETPAAETATPANSLHRMLSKNRNPDDGQSGCLFRRGPEKPGVKIRTSTVAAA